jgi:transcriptional regulator with XRE-family HTH domain
MNLKKLLDKRNLKQKDVALSLGVSETIVSLWVTGKKTPSYNNMVRLAQLLNVKVKSLF